jgi:double-stranded uracil-DNA glycosylase
LTEPILEDLLQPGLRVVFCGTAPGRVSAERRAYYAHPQNRFWRTLFEVGLTPRVLLPDEYPKLLHYGIGLTDIAKHAFGMDKQLPSGALGAMTVVALTERIRVVEPGVLAFTSLTGASKFLQWKVAAGEQPERLGNTRIWALPSPSPTANWAWQIDPWRSLSESVKHSGPSEAVSFGEKQLREAGSAET